MVAEEEMEGGGGMFVQITKMFFNVNLGFMPIEL